ncbi:9591_t:CDS:2 [Paraglomus occultum]|uniref:chitinase n=1 Tax=Paraglomus occultum TaxID=144539 RepID=A0A9N9G2R0_9GLOM|nr:9591_t:CDS:2 [Paraglomus occultum]
MSKYSPVSVLEDESIAPSQRINCRGNLRRLLLILLFFALTIVTLWNVVPGLFLNVKNFDDNSLAPPMDHSTPSGGKVIAGYFVSWGIYARAFTVSDLDPSKLSHILYAFAEPNADGTVILKDPWADTDKHFDGDSWNDTGNNLYGNFKQLGLLKKKNRHLKVSLSIGGWTLSKNFPTMAAHKSSRHKFVESSIALLNDLGLDGLDVDWEYPENSNDARNYVTLLQELRQGLDEYASSKRETNRYLLTAAVPAGASKYRILDLNGMSKYLDYFYLMAYDFCGSWSDVAGHQANLYAGDLNIDMAVRYYIEHGVHAHKIVIGMPLYGRAFRNTSGVGGRFNGVGEGTWEEGVHDYKKLPPNDADEIVDHVAVAAYSYNSNSKELISYDNPHVVARKAQYIVAMGLGGAMFWELSADHPTDNERSLLRTVYNELHGSTEMDRTPNHISFPKSKYDNVKAGFE